MIIDGILLAAALERQLAQEVADADRKFALAVIIVGENVASQRFIEKKQQFGEAIGVSVAVQRFPDNVSAAVLKENITTLGRDPEVSGIVVQLPLPRHIATDALLSLIPPEKDVDALSPHPLILSPVVRAIAHILTLQGVAFRGKRVLVIGAGRLVGEPSALWARGQGAQVTVATQATVNLSEETGRADIIISGAGVSGLVTPEMIRDGVVLFDVGTSEAGGELVGDIAPTCARKASLFTPVPGGIGPITVAMLFKNLLELAGRSRTSNASARSR